MLDRLKRTWFILVLFTIGIYVPPLFGMGEDLAVGAVVYGMSFVLEMCIRDSRCGAQPCLPRVRFCMAGPIRGFLHPLLHLSLIHICKGF